ncbi:glycosyltransferase family 4 protein [Priestia megaterium]
MKINFVLPFTNPTGGIRVIFEHANRLTDMGHDVVCYVPMVAYKFGSKGFKGFIKRCKSSIGNSIKRRNKVNWINVQANIQLVPFINDRYIRKADATFATAWPTAYSVNKLSAKVGKKFYFIQHYEIWSGSKHEVDNSYKLPLKQITIATWLKELMEKEFESTGISVVVNGNDLKVPKEFVKPLNPKKKVLMMYNSLEWKGFKDGLKAFEIAKKTYPSLELVLFGNEYSDEIPGYAKFIEKPDRNQLKELYKLADLFIFPSKFEGWGLTVIEAMGCKCAVVGTNVGCMDDVGKHKVTAMISTPQDIDAMAKNIVELIANPELTLSISEQAYELVNTFTWENSTKKLISIIRNC